MEDYKETRERLIEISPKFSALPEEWEFRVDLKGADLRGADLRGADLSEANLRGADLVGANLFGAEI